MTSNERLNVVPNRMNLIQTKDKSKAAQKGQMLLKRKSKALYMVCRKQAADLKFLALSELEKSVRMACFSIAEAKHANSNLSFTQIIDLAPDETPCHLHRANVSIAGVAYKQYELQDMNYDNFRNIGISGGKDSIERVKNNFKNLTQIIVKLSSLQLSFNQLNAVRKTTNSMANSLEYNIVPKLHNTIGYIVEVLEEREREDLSRIKIFKRMEANKKLQKSIQKLNIS